MPQSEESPSNDSGTKAVRRSAKKSPAPDTGPTCGQCKHWVSGDDGDGECYRNPPGVHLDEEGYFLFRPILDGKEKACGEFRGAN